MHPTKKVSSSAELEQLAHEARQLIFQMITRAESSHIASAYSCIDMLITLYNRVLRIDPKNPYDENRDRFILSKGWAIAALYATLGLRGFFDKKLLDTYCLDNSKLVGCATNNGIPGVEATTGSIGHGLPLGVGIAKALKLQKKDSRVVIMMSDGGCDEGSVWEAALQAGNWQLDNLTLIIDYNTWQSFGRTKDILNLEPFTAKWEAFRWSTKEISGHNFSEIEETMNNVPFTKGKPSLIVAHTLKGKGISAIEDDNDFHYKTPRDEVFTIGKKELGL